MSGGREFRPARAVNDSLDENPGRRMDRRPVTKGKSHPFEGLRKLPLGPALQHLHILYNTALVWSPCEFSRVARLMQGSQAIQSASDYEVDSWLSERAQGNLPSAGGLAMLTMVCDRWPMDTVYAFAGLSAFGARDGGRAEACARQALSLQRECMLARQLVKLLGVGMEVRWSREQDAADAPDVVAVIKSSMLRPAIPAAGPPEPGNFTGKRV